MYSIEGVHAGVAAWEKEGRYGSVVQPAWVFVGVGEPERGDGLGDGRDEEMTSDEARKMAAALLEAADLTDALNAYMAEQAQR
jgi:hypothetical protein